MVFVWFYMLVVVVEVGFGLRLLLLVGSLYVYGLTCGFVFCFALFCG